MRITIAPGILRNTLVLFSGNIVGRIIGIAAIPVLTRLYTPDSFGILAIYVAIVTFTASVATLRYEVAIPLPRTDRLAINITAVCFLLLFLVGSVQAFVLAIAGDALLNLVSAQRLQPYMWLIVVGTLGTSVYDILGYWATRKKAFRVMSTSILVRAVSGTVAKIAFGLGGVVNSGLLLGQAIQQVAGVFRLSVYIAHTAKKPDVRLMKAAAIRYLDVPKYRLPAQLLTIFSAQLPILAFAALFDAADAGQFSVAFMATSLPMTLIGDSIGKAYLGEIAALRANKADQIYHITKKTVLYLLMISLVPCGIFIFGGPMLMPLVLGAEWEQAGWFVSMLSVALMAQFMSTPVIHTLSVINRQKRYLWISSVRAVLVVTAFTAAYVLRLNSYATMALYSTSLALHYVLTLWQVLMLVRAHAANLCGGRAGGKF